MRRISANLIYTNTNPPLKNGIVEVNEHGEVINIIDTGGKLKESRSLEFYNGIISPGFVNAHCHLELSDFKDRIKKETGLPGFINEIVRLKRKTETGNNHIKSIVLYDDLMRKNGIVAVGDISNTDKTISVKVNSKIYYHTFIELMGLGDNSQKIMDENKDLLNKFLSKNLSCSYSPHAPYSVAKELFLRIKEFSELNDTILSIHNQESEAENEMFENKSGELVKVLKNIGADLNNWEATGKNSLKSVIDWLPKNNNIIFVHNTYSSKKDLEQINNNFPNAYWCLCPQSNLYIENSLPVFENFNFFNDRVCIGTDSLASNTTLSVLDEMKMIVSNFDIDFEKLLKWSTINGAKALKIEKQFGTIETGKTPGLNLITSFDFQKKQLTKTSEVKVLV